MGKDKERGNRPTLTIQSGGTITNKATSSPIVENDGYFSSQPNYALKSSSSDKLTEAILKKYRTTAYDRLICSVVLYSLLRLGTQMSILYSAVSTVLKYI